MLGNFTYCNPTRLHFGEQALEQLAGLLPNWAVYRTPDGDRPFGMLKWLSPAQERAWDWSSTAYLGLAFD